MPNSRGRGTTKTRSGPLCRYHGGSTAHIKRKARERIEQALDRMARELLGIATSAESEAVRLAAVKDALDRGGLNAKTAVEVEVGSKPFERLFSGLANYGATDGEPPPTPTALPMYADSDDSGDTADPIDAEVVPDDGTDTRNMPDYTPRWATYGEQPLRRKPRGELVTLEDAVAEQASDPGMRPARRVRSRRV